MSERLNILLGARVYSGQDLGDAAWLVLDAALPTLLRCATSLQVPACPCSGGIVVAIHTPHPLPASSLLCPSGQVSSNGVTVRRASDKAPSCFDFSSGYRLGPDGGKRLAKLVLASAAPLLASLDLRYLLSRVGAGATRDWPLWSGFGKPIWPQPG